MSEIIHGDCLKVLAGLDDKMFQTCVTSPPYFGLRAYDGVGKTKWPAMEYLFFGFTITVPEMECELGHEKDPKDFVGHLVLIFREVRRVLKDDGTIWVNMGDSYASAGKDRTEEQSIAKSGLQGGKKTQMQSLKQQSKITAGLKRKDMIGIPFMMAFALRDDGWFLRSDIIWSKPNPMPESVTDRPTKSHEYIFLLSKSKDYYYDSKAIRTEAKYPGVMKYAWGRAIDGSIKDVRNGNGEQVRKDKQRGHSRRHEGFNDRWDNMTKAEQQELGANKRSVWEITTNSFPDAHFATFPQDLIVDPIKAGSKIGDIVLDPFFGSGTTGIVATKLDRQFVGIEASKKYAEMATNRIKKELGIFSPL